MLEVAQKIHQSVFPDPLNEFQISILLYFHIVWYGFSMVRKKFICYGVILNPFWKLVLFSSSSEIQIQTVHLLFQRMDFYETD